MITNIHDQLKRDEGEILHVYTDSLGIRTAGVGHNLQSHGIDLFVGTPITQQQSDIWLDEDIHIATTQLLTHLPWTGELDRIRQAVLINQCFNMGIRGLCTFKTYLLLVKNGKYSEAAQDELHTLWARQVGPRATRLAKQMETGEWQ